ncbi:hypothetical protein C2869_10410 [Saccharobesus litoralis]|uniref:nitrite reductase (cytochrome; ammonia-forming) n=1 Tax=Saccharobesus litoralis TaxID=2172099 RepID=A0A2S0VRH3_9ALTE|nr:ammonia-forming cytochrome c nitrite reductase subunit c552 [Saccharobesus litoralis]AWB66816.1 hypothetical protein C2869_10410 [Saccharobesus litoralis]
MKRLSWIIWTVLTLALSGYLGYTLVAAEDKTEFIVGAPTHGHFQIELACESCHTSPFGGPEILQNACLNCHEQELEAANDSHPVKKFTDPRNADRLEILNAKDCVTCHREHQHEQTMAMGVTLPDDFCFHCHQDVAENRPSHEGMGFETCASAGCHNYHDNRALYEDFLVKHAGKPDMLSETMKLVNDNVTSYLAEHPDVKALIADDADIPTQQVSEQDQTITEHWAATVHAQVGVNCTACHNNEQDEWLPQPKLDVCSNCHQDEWTQFTESHHGMRLSDKVDISLSPMTPAMSRLPFHQEAMDKDLTCSGCHDPHTTDTKFAAVDACMSCHNDEHTNNFTQSKHFALWQQEQQGLVPEGTGVTCATCHMPKYEEGGEVRVMHNQNHNLRPNEKMIRSACMNCHSLEFSIDALADEQLIKSNFIGKPSQHIESIDMAVKRTKQ